MKRRWYHTKYVLSAKDIADIEKVLNARGITEAVVSVEDGRIKVLHVEKKKVS